jgi:hypothetical protein
MLESWLLVAFNTEKNPLALLPYERVVIYVVYCLPARGATCRVVPCKLLQVVMTISPIQPHLTYKPNSMNPVHCELTRLRQHACQQAKC